MRAILQLTLFALTLLTLALAGGLWWSPPSPAGAPASFADLLLAGVPYALWTAAILGAHEMGHFLACRYYGIPATWPFFIPGIPPFGTFGAVIRIRASIPDRRALFDVAAAGPIAGFAVALPVLVVGLLTAEPFVVPEGFEPPEFQLGRPLVRSILGEAFSRSELIQVNSLFGAGWVGMLVTALNLFPVGQLDGGHAAYAVSPRLHRRLSRVTLLVLAALIVYQAAVLRQIPAYLLWFGILMWMRDRHPRLVDESAPPGGLRRWVALLLLVIFLLSFMPMPFIFGGR